MPDTVLHQLTTERGTYRLVSPREGFAYVMRDTWKIGEMQLREGNVWVVVPNWHAYESGVLADMGRVCHEFESSYLARV